METLNKVYHFHPKHTGTGYAIAAKNFKEARKIALSTDLQECCEIPFIDIRGSIIKKEGKPIKTKYKGQLNVKQQGELGMLWFWCPECENVEFEFGDFDGDYYHSMKCKKCGHEDSVPYSEF